MGRPSIVLGLLRLEARPSQEHAAPRRISEFAGAGEWVGCGGAALPHRLCCWPCIVFRVGIKKPLACLVWPCSPGSGREKAGAGLKLNTPPPVSGSVSFSCGNTVGSFEGRSPSKETSRFPPLTCLARPGPPESGRERAGAKRKKGMFWRREVPPHLPCGLAMGLSEFPPFWIHYPVSGFFAGRVAPGV